MVRIHGVYFLTDDRIHQRPIIFIFVFIYIFNNNDSSWGLIAPGTVDERLEVELPCLLQGSLSTTMTVLDLVFEERIPSQNAGFPIEFA